MEKITILCGMANREYAKAFMAEVADEIRLRGCRIERIKSNDLVIFTKYTQTCFFYDKDSQPLNRVKADAIFGMEPYKQNLAVYLKESAPYNANKGLVDYICEAEKNGAIAEAKAELETACEKYDEMIARISLKQFDAVGYAKTDCDITYDLYKKLMNNTNSTLPEIKNVVFNNPATIVFWADGTKTVVKSRGDDIYDPEKGMAMAIAKKTMGNKREYYHTFLHWLKKV